MLIGTGGREHALATQLAEDPAVESLICAPGNPGMAQLGECVNINAEDAQAVAALAVTSNADLVVIGPEAPLVAGAADAVRAKNIPVFGPGREAARLEGSKEFSKQVMASAGVPTAASRVCTSRDEAEAALQEFGAPYVVKDDGLTGGKGVIVTEDLQEALKHAESCDRMVVEEYLDGPEVSLFVVSDGSNAVPLLPAQDFKRIGEGGTGANTGGMGAYSPLPWADPDLVDEIMRTVAEPTLAEMTRRGTPFIGALYCGLALTSRGLRVVEFNARFGDPEIQAVLALLDSSLSQLLLAAATGRLDELGPVQWKAGAAVCVVLANEGYPSKVVKGRPISGVNAAGLLHAGTSRDSDGRLVATGGRVLNSVGVGESVADARTESYRQLKPVKLEGAYWRGDIAADL